MGDICDIENFDRSHIADIGKSVLLSFLKELTSPPNLNQALKGNVTFIDESLNKHFSVRISTSFMFVLIMFDSSQIKKEGCTQMLAARAFPRLGDLLKTSSAGAITRNQVAHAAIADVVETISPIMTQVVKSYNMIKV